MKWDNILQHVTMQIDLGGLIYINISIGTESVFSLQQLSFLFRISPTHVPSFLSASLYVRKRGAY